MAQRVNYSASVLYWFFPLKRLIYIMAPILFTVFNVIVIKCTLPEVLVFWLPMYLLTNKCIRKLSGNIRSNKWTNIYETILFPALFFSVILETFCISQRKFVVTKKEKVDNDTKYQLMHILPHVFFAILSIIGIVNCIRLTFTTGSIGMIVVLFWLLINLYNIVMSIFFMTGRKIYRKYERSMAKVDCKIASEDYSISCVTNDISEDGFSVTLDFPQYIDCKTELMITLNTDRYMSEFKAKIVHVTNIKKEWKYSFQISEVEENEKKQLLQIIYDRVPSLPQLLDKDVSTFEDLKINTFKRVEKSKMSNRKLPRVSLAEAVKSMDNETVKLRDFNYECARINTGFSAPENLIIALEYGITLNCTFVSDFSESGDKLYSITNYKAIAQDKNFQAILRKWIGNYNKSTEENKKADADKKNDVSDELDEMIYM
jgi:cellulose synthase (UDP-forming)